MNISVSSPVTSFCVCVLSPENFFCLFMDLSSLLYCYSFIVNWWMMKMISLSQCQGPPHCNIRSWQSLYIIRDSRCVIFGPSIHYPTCFIHNGVVGDTTTHTEHNLDRLVSISESVDLMSCFWMETEHAPIKTWFPVETGQDHTQIAWIGKQTRNLLAVRKQQQPPCHCVVFSEPKSKQMKKINFGSWCFTFPHRALKHSHVWTLTLLTVTQRAAACTRQSSANVTCEKPQQVQELLDVLLCFPTTKPEWSQLRRFSRTELGSGADSSLSCDLCSRRAALTDDHCLWSVSVCTPSPWKVQKHCTSSTCQR